MSDGRVVVLGDAHLDVRVAPVARIRRGGDVPAAIDLMAGGQGANVAVRLARRGVPVELVAALADDRAGALVREALAAEGVELRQVAVEATGTAVVLAEVDGERTMFSRRTPFATRVDADALLDAGWLIVSGYVLHEPEAASLTAALAASAGRRVVLACAVPDERVHGWREAAAALHADLWIGNRDELRLLGPVGTSGIAVTDAAGASVNVAGVQVDSRTPTGAPARDTTGAGDAFAAGLVATLRQRPWPPAREDLEDAVEEAVALASRVARVAGAQSRVEGEPEAPSR